jgi:hypothetical protein
MMFDGCRVWTCADGAVRPRVVAHFAQKEAHPKNASERSVDVGLGQVK